MRDWEALVERQLNGIALDPADSAEVVAELAAHLAETCEELRKQGIGEEEAVWRALSEVDDWQKLRRSIQFARTKENVMTNRVKQFWLPSLLTLLLTMGLLMLIQVFGPHPWVVGLHDRNGWSLIPPVSVVYLPWLLALPLIGALGAFLSCRSGGSHLAVFSSILFPVLPYLVFFLMALPMILILNHQIAHHIMFSALIVGFFGWVLVPGAALLAGGLLAKFFLSRRLDSRRIVSG
jgi:hypothetical protein